MPPGHSDSDSNPPTVGLAKGAVEAARHYVEENDLSDQLHDEILEKAEELEAALNDMSPVQGRNRISWYEAPSKLVNRKYEELMTFLNERNVILEVEVPENFSL